MTDLVLRSDGDVSAQRAPKQGGNDVAPVVLVVHRDRYVRALLVEILERGGEAAAGAADHDEALKVLATMPVRALVLDLHLPEPGALPLLRALRAVPERGTLPILLMARRNDRVARALALEAGATDFITKPFQPRDLLNRVRAQRRAADAWQGVITQRIQRRRAVARALNRFNGLSEGADLQTAADAVCTELKEAVGGAGIIVFLKDHAVAVGANGVEAWGLETEAVLPTPVANYLRDRARRGPWLERSARMISTPELTLDEGSLVCAPLHSRHDLEGVLVLEVDRPNRWWDSDHHAAALDEVSEHADSISGLLGQDLHEWRIAHQHSTNLHHLIRHQRFSPAFQPICRLVDLTVVGHEALTRFHDGTPPETRFREAAALGAGSQLEAATLTAAVGAARHLPDGQFLSINVSAAYLTDSDAIVEQLTQCDKPIVLELTEHEPIDDYVAFRQTLSQLRPSTRLSIDDAGSGFASLRHVVELAPDYIKLDRTWVDAIDRDPGRQALISGLRHYTQATGAQLIAEGIERLEELQVLGELGVELGQGFLLGRPTVHRNN